MFYQPFRMQAILQTLLLVTSLIGLITSVNGEFKLTIVHTNDMHSRIAEISRSTGACNPPKPCYGGFARVAHQAKLIKQNIPNTIFLNAGDSYQGSPYYSIFKWSVLVPLLEKMSIDVMSLGNHEFDDGVPGLTPFLKAIRIPVVTSNIDTSKEPSMVDHTALKPWHMLVVDNVKIAVIGYLTPETKDLSSTGQLIFKDEVSTITKYAREAKEGGANLVIALGHSGFFKDQDIAKNVAEVDVVVGGHTDTFLYTGTPPDKERPALEYPLMVQQPSGKKVPVVQAYGYTKYLGKLDLVWDDNYQLVSATGNPILLNASLPKDPEVDAEIQQWTNKLSDTLLVKKGFSKVHLDGSCRHKECNMGNLITDAYLHFVVTQSDGTWSDAPITLMNGGAIRASVELKENITWGDLLTVLPFGNQLVRLRMKGSTLLKALHRSVERYDTDRNVGFGEFLQVSGLKVEYEQNENGQLVLKKGLARCGRCNIPTYHEIQPNQEYIVVTTVFVADGGDGYHMFKEEAIREYVYDKNDLDILADYTSKISPLYPAEEGRIKIPEVLKPVIIPSPLVQYNDTKPTGHAGNTAASSSPSVLQFNFYFIIIISLVTYLFNK
uniref:Venom 5-prime nucleotidase 1 n=1 Tax=Ectomocoris sp. TaxID=3104572 RepID=A0AB38ZEE9_9HEMI